MRRALKWVGPLYVVWVVAGVWWYNTHGHHHTPDLRAILPELTGLLGLPTALIAAVRLGKKEPASARLEDVADQLAQGVRRQWEAEARVRRLNDPFPLSVE
ncbi:hypothetical protein ACFYZB_44670 [Streptomyces sp. NPDC001852]|uniref:hypothetical protein n=1 Tax=Streptomyces sp. NPDC001852 TaxID=3364619 RepID=UPI0036B2838C